MKKQNISALAEASTKFNLHPTNLQLDLPAALGSDPRLGDGDFPSCIDHVARLGAMPVSLLLTVRAAALFDFLCQEMMDDLQPGLGAQGFDLRFGFQDHLQHRQIQLQVHRVDSWEKRTGGNQ